MKPIIIIVLSIISWGSFGQAMRGYSKGGFTTGKLKIKLAVVNKESQVDLDSVKVTEYQKQRIGGKAIPQKVNETVFNKKLKIKSEATLDYYIIEKDGFYIDTLNRNELRRHIKIELIPIKPVQKSGIRLVPIR